MGGLVRLGGLGGMGRMGGWVSRPERQKGAKDEVVEIYFKDRSLNWSSDLLMSYLKQNKNIKTIIMGLLGNTAGRFEVLITVEILLKSI